jgi:HK97 family phage major capsid protein
VSTHVDQVGYSLIRAQLEQLRATAARFSSDDRRQNLYRRAATELPLVLADHLPSGRRIGGALAECMQERGYDGGPHKMLVPHEVSYYAARADVAGSSPGGGYLIETINAGNAAPSIQSMLFGGRVGVTVLDSKANIAIPKVTGTATAQWLSTETAQVAEADLTFGQQSFSPHQLAAYVELSRPLLLQSSPDAGVLAARELRRRIARVIEQAMLSGSGVAGQPHGLIGMSGVNAVAGASFALSTAITCATNAGDALTPESSGAWITTRSVAGLLRQRGEVLGTVNSFVPLWRGPVEAGFLADYASFSTSNAPASTAVFGPWSFAVLVDFLGGVELVANPYQQGNFQTGVVGIRALCSVDFGLVWPQSFSVISSIT